MLLAAVRPTPRPAAPARPHTPLADLDAEETAAVRLAARVLDVPAEPGPVTFDSAL
jgi:FXSXX-COOH protein